MRRAETTSLCLPISYVIDVIAINSPIKNGFLLSHLFISSDQPRYLSTMRTVSTVVALLSIASANAFIVPGNSVTTPSRSRLFAEAAPTRTPELEAAIAEVRECAAAFSDETAHFANVWIDKMLEGKKEGMAAGLLEDCLLDENQDKCTKYETALKNLDHLLGVGADEQF